MNKHLHKDFRKIPRKWRWRHGYYHFFDHLFTRNFFFKLTRKGRKRFYKKLEVYLKEGGKGKVVPVDRRSDLSYEEFMSEYVRKGVPVILTGKAKDWPCVQNWSLDYFNELHGEDKVIYLNHNRKEDGNYEDTTLGAILDRIKAGEDDYYRFYPLLKKHPEHLMDFDYKWLRKCRFKRSYGEAFQAFLSPKGGYTALHNAGVQNIFIQAHGEKIWRLYPNEYACIIDPDPVHNFNRGAPLRDNLVFNPFQEDNPSHELYQYMDGYEVHLKAGDVFYNPPYMWHCVLNPTESIGVGYRYITPWTAFKAAPLYNFLEYLATKPPIWKSWRNMDDVNLVHLAESGKLEEIAKKRGIEKLKSTVESSEG